ncbi:hypothetical protein N7540_011637 [Penicillium herquei]|nr:hypothetical protein N7540_011637 [Penicillium herquei]
MGGKPWQSKGCPDCRRRKIKCDEQRPECGNCIKRGLKCQGWDRYRHFIGAPSAYEAKVQQATSSSASTVDSAALARSQYPILPVTVHSAETMRLQIFASFYQRYFFSESFHSTTSSDSFVMSRIAGLAQKSQMVDRAMSAISCLFLGKMNRDATVLNHGIYLYNSAMRQISSMIQRGIYSDELLYITIICVEINALYAPNGLNPLGTHIAGLSTLLRLYKEKSKGDPIVDTIYNSNQKLYLALTSTGMNLSKAEHDYLMEPTNGDALLEILQTIASIGSLKSAIETKHNDPVACQNILQKCYETQERLMGLQKDGHLGKEPSLWQCKKFEVPSPEGIFGAPYQFTSLRNAILYTLFWANMVILLPILHNARSLVRSHSSTSVEDHGPQFEDMEYVLRGAYADKIPRAMPYCFQKGMKASFSKIIFFPINMASVHFIDTKNREKLNYCHDILRHVEAIGLQMASYIREVTTHRWERRWGDAADQFDCISLRQTDRTFCNTHPGSLSKALTKALSEEPEYQSDV